MSSPAIAHGLRRARPQADVDPLALGVPARDVVERLGVEACAEPVVQDAQDVPRELGRDAARVVVGGEDPLGRLHEVDAEKERVARRERRGQVGEEPGPHARLEVPDGASQERDHARAAAGQERQVALEVPDDGVDGDPGVLLDDGRRGRPQGRLVDVERHKPLERLRLAHGREEKTRLRARPRAELDEGVGPGLAGDVAGMGLEDRPLAPGQVVLGEAGDLVEERRAAGVVMPLRREPLGGRGETAEGVLPQRRLEVGGAEMDVDRIRLGHEGATAGSGTRVHA